MVWFASFGACDFMGEDAQAAGPGLALRRAVGAGGPGAATVALATTPLGLNLSRLGHPR